MSSVPAVYLGRICGKVGVEPRVKTEGVMAGVSGSDNDAFELVTVLHKFA